MRHRTTDEPRSLQTVEGRRSRSGLALVLLVLSYVPIMVGLSRWFPDVARPLGYIWAAATLVAWFRFLPIDWPRRNFNVRPPDPPRPSPTKRP